MFLHVGLFFSRVANLTWAAGSRLVFQPHTWVVGIVPLLALWFAARKSDGGAVSFE